MDLRGAGHDHDDGYRAVRGDGVDRLEDGTRLVVGDLVLRLLLGAVVGRGRRGGAGQPTAG